MRKCSKATSSTRPSTCNPSSPTCSILRNQTLPCCASHITATVTSTNHKSVITATSPHNITNTRNSSSNFSQEASCLGSRVWPFNFNAHAHMHHPTLSHSTCKSSSTAHGTTEFILATTATKSRERHQSLARAPCLSLPHRTCPASENAGVPAAYCHKRLVLYTLASRTPTYRHKP